MSSSGKTLLFCCGSVMMLAQYIAVREVGSTFFSTEIIAVLTTMAILIGPCLAYAIADRVSERILLIWSLVTFSTLVCLPTGVRYLVAVMTAAHMEWIAMLLVLLIVTIASSAFFAVFLPRCTQSGEDFRNLYLCELAGAVTALLLLTQARSWAILLVGFWSLIVVVIHLAFRRTFLTIVSALVVVAAGCSYRTMDGWAARQYYRFYWKKKNPRVLAVDYSPYQRIEVVEDDKGRSLHLDGVPYYDSDDLDWFNFYIARLPGMLVREKRRALVIGSGSLGSTGHLVRMGFKVTTVDIDREVPELGMKYFKEVNRLTGKDFQLVIADARRFIRSVADGTFDLIVLDVPAPYKLQTALLYTPSFFQQLDRSMSPDGIISINTCNGELDGAIATSIAAGALATFDDVVAIRGGSTGLTILYCGHQLPFTTDRLNAVVGESEHRGFTIYNQESVKNVVGAARPNCRDNLCALLLLSRYELPGIEQWLEE